MTSTRGDKTGETAQTNIWNRKIRGKIVSESVLSNFKREKRRKTDGREVKIQEFLAGIQRGGYEIFMGKKVGVYG